MATVPSCSATTSTTSLLHAAARPPPASARRASGAADALSAALGVDDQPQLADVVRPARERRRRPRGPRRLAVAGDRTRAGPCPARDGRAVEHLLLEERALRRRDPLEEREQRVDVARASAGAGPSRLLAVGRQPGRDPGQRHLARPRGRPPRPTWPAVEHAAPRVCESTRRGERLGDPPSGTMWSRSAITFSSGHAIAPRSTSLPPSRSVRHEPVAAHELLDDLADRGARERDVVAGPLRPSPGSRRRTRRSTGSASSVRVLAELGGRLEQPERRSRPRPAARCPSRRAASSSSSRPSRTSAVDRPHAARSRPASRSRPGCGSAAPDGGRR